MQPPHLAFRFGTLNLNLKFSLDLIWAPEVWSSFCSHIKLGEGFDFKVTLRLQLLSFYVESVTTGFIKQTCSTDLYDEGSSPHVAHLNHIF